MRKFGTRLGAAFNGGEVVELVGDVGSGKTTLAKGIAQGMGVDEDVQSPSFTISRVYEAARGLQLAHYDFYRLSDAGIMEDELAETADNAATVIVIEWADIVKGVLPEDRLMIYLSSPSLLSRHLEIKAGGPRSARLLEALV